MVTPPTLSDESETYSLEEYSCHARTQILGMNPGLNFSSQENGLL